MKPIVLPLLLVALLTSCSKPTVQVDTPPESTPTPAPAIVAATPTPEPVIAVASTPAPVATPAPAAPVAELAPPGVFYLLEAVRIETDSGVTGLPPGSGVKLLHDDVYLTTAGEAHLQPEVLTNDMTRARQVLAADRASQASLKATLADQAQASAAAVAARDNQSASSRATAAAEQQTADMQNRVAALGIERLAIQKKLSMLRAKQSGENFRAGAQGHIIASSTVDESRVLINRVAEIDTELAQLRRR